MMGTSANGWMDGCKRMQKSSVDVACGDVGSGGTMTHISNTWSMLSDSKSSMHSCSSAHICSESRECVSHS
jgi:hypothetical protein